MASHTVGLVTDNPAATIQLRALLDAFGYTIAYTLTADQILHAKPLLPSLWVVISEHAADVFDVLSSWSDAPVFLADDMPQEENRVHYEQWRQSLYEKLAKTLEELEPDDEYTAPKAVVTDPHSFKEVWVLAASLGGPEAVREFLSNIHPELPVAFVYAQHIETNFDRILPSVMNKTSRFKVDFCHDGETLRRGAVTVMPSHTLTQLDRRGRMHVKEGQVWDKPYTPNINQVINNVAEFYQQHMGIIIFSGMCDDGAEASIALKEQGVPLWAQEPESCICPAMPEAVIRKSAVNYIGTALELARHLNNRHGKYHKEQQA